MGRAWSSGCGIYLAREFCICRILPKVCAAGCTGSAVFSASRVKRHDNSELNTALNLPGKIGGQQMRIWLRGGQAVIGGGRCSQNDPLNHQRQVAVRTFSGTKLSSPESRSMISLVSAQKLTAFMKT